LAPFTIAPDASRTVPMISPKVDCPKAGAHEKARKKRSDDKTERQIKDDENLVERFHANVT
jgi:hypothetical protein